MDNAQRFLNAFAMIEKQLNRSPALRGIRAFINY